VAPRPGLEPGTYGLTVELTAISMAAKLLAVVAERIVDGGILHLIKQWLKAPVIGEDDNGVPIIPVSELTS